MKLAVGLVAQYMKLSLGLHRLEILFYWLGSKVKNLNCED